MTWLTIAVVGLCAVSFYIASDLAPGAHGMILRNHEFVR